MKEDRMISPERIATRLVANAGVFRHLLESVEAEQARWKPSPEKWSMLEVVCHLADEERYDFRTRLRLILADPSAAWPSIDPPAWTIERAYNRRSLTPSLDDFLHERERTVEWLRGVGPRDLTVAKDHPAVGPISAGDLLAAWLAHDLIHIRQITRLHYEYLDHASGFSSRYAGDW